jgi:hypothetical protein
MIEEMSENVVHDDALYRYYVFEGDSHSGQWHCYSLLKIHQNVNHFHFQVLGKVPTISVEKTDGCQVIKSLS